MDLAAIRVGSAQHGEHIFAVTQPALGQAVIVASPPDVLVGPRRELDGTQMLSATRIAGLLLHHPDLPHQCAIGDAPGIDAAGVAAGVVIGSIMAARGRK